MHEMIEDDYDLRQIPSGQQDGRRWATLFITHLTSISENLQRSPAASATRHSKSMISWVATQMAMDASGATFSLVLHHLRPLAPAREPTDDKPDLYDALVAFRADPCSTTLNRLADLLQTVPVTC